MLGRMIRIGLGIVAVVWLLTSCTALSSDGKDGGPAGG